ncbi:MAG: hypothetical protein ACOC22_03885 [bacterium]
MSIDKIEKRKTIHSGGAKGADSLFSWIGLNYGLDVVTHSFPDHSPTQISKKSGLVIQYSPSELEYARQFIDVVRNQLNRKPPKNQFVDNLLLRNYYQVSNSQLVFAISTIVDFENCIVKGGTGYATKLAHNFNIPILIFDQERWEYFCSIRKSNFFKLKRKPNIFRFPDHFAGIGSRDLNDGVDNEIIEIFKPLIYKSVI